MTDPEKKVLEGFLSKTLKMDTEDMAGLYNDAGELTSLSVASEADTTRIKKLKEDASSQYKRGLKEGATKIESELKDKYEIDSELVGLELVDHIIEDKTKTQSDADGDITKHPQYVSLKLDLEKQMKAKDKEWQKKIDEMETTFSKKSLFSKIKERALTELNGLKPILPEDGKKAQRWKDKFIEEFEKYEYQEQDGNFAVLKDGKLLTDSHGHSKSFVDHVRDTANDFFDFQVSDDRSSSGNRTQQTTSTAVPRNDTEYADAMRKAKTPQERISIMESYVKK